MEHLNNNNNVFDDAVEFEDQDNVVPSTNSDFDSDSEFETSTLRSYDTTTAMEFRNGKDIQGIPWDTSDIGKNQLRKIRMTFYVSNGNLGFAHLLLHKEFLEVEKGMNFYDFKFNTRLVRPTVAHEQLRNLVWATSKHDIYLMHNNSVGHWSALLQRGKEVLNVTKPIVPIVKHPGFSAQPISRIQISTISVKENLVVAGGHEGELICKNLNHSGVAFCSKITNDNAITNHVDVYSNPSGSLRVTSANNDSHVRVFDAEKFASLSCFKYDWSVNNTCVSPDGKLLAVLGDGTECLIADANTGMIIESLKGHLDYSFASAWHPDGRILATGNQDKTCRLWDIRNPSHSLALARGRMTSIKGLSFTTDGRFLAMAEEEDFVHILDSKSGYRQSQEIDLLGDIGGISFSPDTEALFVGISNSEYGSLLELNRRHQNHYLDSMF